MSWALLGEYHCVLVRTPRSVLLKFQVCLPGFDPSVDRLNCTASIGHEAVWAPAMCYERHCAGPLPFIPHAMGNLSLCQGIAPGLRCAHAICAPGHAGTPATQRPWTSATTAGWTGPGGTNKEDQRR